MVKEDPRVEQNPEWCQIPKNRDDPTFEKHPSIQNKYPNGDHESFQETYINHELFISNLLT